MAEVSRQLGPLEDKIDRTSNSMERLFNSNGGPPGYLQTARAEDKRTFEMVFNTLEVHRKDMEPLKAFVQEQKIREKERDRKQNLWLGALGALISAWGLIEHFHL